VSEPVSLAEAGTASLEAEERQFLAGQKDGS